MEVKVAVITSSGRCRLRRGRRRRDRLRVAVVVLGAAAVLVVAGRSLGELVGVGVCAGGVTVVVAAACVMPEPNSSSLCQRRGEAPRAIASGSAYSLATGLEGSI